MNLTFGEDETESGGKKKWEKLYCYHFYLSDNTEKIVKINKKYYDRLRKLYFDQPELTDQSESLFHERLLKLLIRYDIVSGEVRGYQMALPERVFEYLKKECHLQHECFASPLNACPAIGSFCSRFPDTDKYFGSEGSFFKYNPEEGVYESNPPFVEECMIRNIKHILDLLNNAEEKGKALTFFIIVPKWDDDGCESYNLTVYGKHPRPKGENQEGKYFVDKIDMDKGNHFYRNGMAYQDDFSVMSANSGSLMLVLQTKEARKKVPIDRYVLEGVKKRWGKRSSEFINGKKGEFYRKKDQNKRYTDRDSKRHHDDYKDRNPEEYKNEDYKSSKRSYDDFRTSNPEEYKNEDYESSKRHHDNYIEREDKRRR